ncbi:hypothetical protein ACWEF9_06080 [Streptomyces sp. NPDC004980]
MDQKNPFETPNTFKLHRAEYLVGFVLSIVLIIIHFGEIRWIPFIALFAYIDLIGYIPGAIAFRRSSDGRIPKVFYVLYNSMHSLITQAAVVGLWLWLIGPEWALLAIPFHVLGDRGVFGNFLKPFGLPFEPVSEPLYQRLVDQVRTRAGAAGLSERVPVVSVPDDASDITQGAGL